MTKNTDKQCTIQLASYRNVVCTYVVLLSLLLTSGLVFAALPEEVSPDNPAEYMIYQYPGSALLIRIDLPGIEFESRVFGPEQQLVMASRIPGRRLGPLYQLLEAVELPRQLIIQIRPKETSERSRISMELVQLTGQDRNGTAQLKAFRLLSLAAESTQANDSTTWAMKIHTLQRAERAFEALGWEELRLWSGYYAAHLIFFKLQDDFSTLETARRVEAAARKAGVDMVELAALQLEAAALSVSAAAGSGPAAVAGFDETHRTYQRVAAMADDLGLHLERGRAIFNDGLVWERQEDITRALEQYEMALSIAVSAGNIELANRVRNKAASAYEEQGSLSGAIEMLDQIGDEGVLESENLNRAKSLYEKGRLLAETGYFSRAAEALAQSLQLLQVAGSGSRAGPARLLLGQSYYNMGYMEQALTVLREAIKDTPANGNAKLLGDAFNTLAAIGRFQGNAEHMAADREQQAVFLESGHDQAKFVFEKSLDALGVQGSSSVTASSLFSRSRQLAIKAGDKALQHRSILYQCSLLSPGEAGGDPICSDEAVRRSVDFLVFAGIPSFALEAKWLWSKILRAEGLLSRAIQQMTQLLEDMRFYRAVIPGVLGAWYWENRKELYRDYMSMMLKRSGVNDSKLADGRQTLVALDRLRAIERAGVSPAVSAIESDGQDASGRIRSLLANNQYGPEHPASTAEVLELNERLRLAREHFTATAKVLDLRSLDKLLMQMSDGAALLSYYFSGDGTYALVGRNDGVRVFQLAATQEIKKSLADVRASMGKKDSLALNSSLKLLGKRLVAPIESLLPELIYLMPAGPLTGFPFDLLRHEGRYLAEKHRIINITSPVGLNDANKRVDTGGLDLFFLAGKPDFSRDVFDYRLRPSAEIRAITERFVGPALHIVQGSALGRDEFQGGRFEAANIIHLAIPGRVDLEFPDRSRMVLSATADQPSLEILAPADIGKSSFKASLAVLSGLNIEGKERFNLDHQLGFVSDFLTSGVPLVITSLWRIPDTRRAQFFAEFYRNLANNPDIAASLAKTRRSFLTANEAEDYPWWGGFQIYIN